MLGARSHGLTCPFSLQTVLLFWTLLFWDVLHDVPGGKCHAPGAPCRGKVTSPPQVPSPRVDQCPERLVPSALGDCSPLPCPALRASPTGGEVGPAAAPHHPVLAHRLRHLRGLHQSVGLQAPLERCAGGAAPRGSHCRPHRECPLRSLVLCQVATGCSSAAGEVPKPSVSLVFSRSATSLTSSSTVPRDSVTRRTRSASPACRSP